MAITSYCKKCGQDVPVGDICENCGARLAKGAIRAAWCVEHHPVKDWMSWNAAMRILLPVMAVAFILILVLEGMAGGAQGMENLLRSGLLVTLLGILVMIAAGLLLVFILQGEDWQDCVVDSRGLHVNCYLPNPTPLKLILRLRSPALMQQADPEDDIPTVLISQQDLAWKDVARVQLWPEKTLILFYAPSWWMRLYLPCTPFTYEDSMFFIREKLGRKKNVALPWELVAPPKPKEPKPARSKEPESQQVTMAEILPSQEGEGEKPEDFVPLADVLEEIKSSAEKGEA